LGVRIAIVRSPLGLTGLTASGPRYPEVEEKLQAIHRGLAELVSSVEARGLRARARTFEAVVKHWTTVAPTKDQESAMIEVLDELLGSILEARGAASSAVIEVSRGVERRAEAETLPPPTVVARARRNGA
jgi:hypothetical protein